MLRKRRSSTIRKRSTSVPATLSVSPRVAKKRKEWNNENMTAALKAVEDGENLSRAARDHGIPKTTLYDRVSGKVVRGVNPGPRPYLTPRRGERAWYLLETLCQGGLWQDEARHSCSRTNCSIG